MIKWYAKPGSYGLTKEHDSDAGYDLRTPEFVAIEPGEIVQIPTGVFMSMPDLVYAQVCSKSGLALKKNVGVDGGVVDAGYRGEVCVLLRNYGKETVTFEPGDKIAQVVFHKISHALEKVEKIEDLGEGDRGANGFGSTGAR